MRCRSLAPAALLISCGPLTAAVERVVIVKLDGIPASVLERELQHRDPVTQKSTLPWIERIFNQGGSRVPNFYVRAISLSAPSWSLLDTGRHLEIRGNAEFDRYTYHVYDYLNFFPFYVGYALSRRVDMPGVEVLDQLNIPLLIDFFPYAERYQSFQLFQRGVRWKTLQHSLQHRFSRSLRQLLDEWTIGFEIGSSVEEQTERELIEKLSNPRIRYLDYFTGEYDHVAHGTPDPASQRMALQSIDALIGRIWTAIESSPLAGRTVLAVLSDHGMNTQPGVYSQGYDLVQFFNSRAGGAHHVVTNRHPMTEYKLKGLDPFVSEVVTPSEESLYLKGAANQYPTVLLDLDGNERASVYLRNSDFNLLHILLEELNRPPMQSPLRQAAIRAFFQAVDRHRPEWHGTVAQLREELAAIRRYVEEQRRRLEEQPKKWTPAQRNQGLDKDARRLAVQVDALTNQERRYSEYVDALVKILALTPSDFEKRRIPASDVIPRRAMSETNGVHALRNYVVGPASGGLVLAPDGSLDLAKSFQQIDYLPLLASLSVRNNVQTALASHPVDFVALRIPSAPFAAWSDEPLDENAVWLYGGENRQAVVLSRRRAGELELRYVPVRDLQQDSHGVFHIDSLDFAPGLPLALFEDKDLGVPEGQRVEWLQSWHSDLAWLRAAHNTEYSNGLLALHEQFHQRIERDGDLLERFRARRRRLVEPDFVIFANDHWNFNVRGFNPGGNHGSMRRISTRAVLMFAGGGETSIPKNQVVAEPYDSLSFVPTILELMGQDQEAQKLPGRPILEVLSQAKSSKPGTRN